MAALEDVAAAALALEPDERAALAQRLLASLDELVPEEADRLWGEEARRRLNDFHSARAAAVPAEEVAEKARKLFR